MLAISIISSAPDLERNKFLILYGGWVTTAAEKAAKGERQLLRIGRSVVELRFKLESSDYVLDRMDKGARDAFLRMMLEAIEEEDRRTAAGEAAESGKSDGAESQVENTQREAPKKFYRVAEFCRHFDMSRASFYREVTANRLHIVKRGRTTLITATEAERWFTNLCKIGV